MAILSAALRHFFILQDGFLVTVLPLFFGHILQVDDFVRFINDFSTNKRFHDILHRHQPRHTPEIIHYERDMLSFLNKIIEQLKNSVGFGNRYDLPLELAQRLVLIIINQMFQHIVFKDVGIVNK